MTFPLTNELHALYARYNRAISVGNLGEAITARDEIGKLVIQKMEHFRRALHRYEAPLSEPEDGEEAEANDLPF